MTKGRDKAVYYAEHQPTLLPWMPLIAKVVKSERFTILSQVSFTKDDFVHKCKLNGTPLTLPIGDRYKGKPISTVETDPRHTNKFLKSFDSLYGKKAFPFRDRFFVMGGEILSQNAKVHLAPFNVLFLEALLKMIGWQGELRHDSEPIGETKTERMVNRLREQGMQDGDVYLCGKGTLSYLDASFPFPVSVQSIAKPEEAPSVLDIVLKERYPRPAIERWCAENVTWSEPRLIKDMQ